MKFTTTLLLALFSILAISCEQDSIEQPEAKSVTINRIDVLSYRTGSYDFNNDPDVYINLIEVIASNPAQGFTTNVISDAAQGTVLEYQTNFTISDFDAEWDLLLYDYDAGDADDYIDGGTFDFRKFVEDRPATIAFNGPTLSIELVVQWND